MESCLRYSIAVGCITSLEGDKNNSSVTGTFTGEMVLHNGKVIPPTGKAFDVEFGQTTKWDGDLLVEISAFWDSAMQAQQIGLA